MRRSATLALALAGAACLPATASAATIGGTVVAPPKVTTKSAVISIVDSTGAARKVVIPVKGAIRARIGRLTPGQLRYGDAVTATGTKKALAGVKPHATTLRVGTRGKALTFDAITDNLQATKDGVTQALAQVQALPQQTDAVTALNAAPAETRNQLFAARAKINDTIADLRSEATTLEGIAQTVPAAASLTTTATSARTAADALDDAVAQLDTTINAVGGVSPPALPIGGVSTVSDVFQLVLNVLANLPGGIGKV